jgi:hypothetical protein
VTPSALFGVSPSIWQLSDEWMWQPFGVEALNRPRRGLDQIKGAVKRAQNGVGRPVWADQPSPVSAQFGPSSLPDGSHPIFDLQTSACGSLTSSSLRFR